MNSSKIYANTNKQDLAEHLFAVGYIASKVMSASVPEDNKMQKSAFIAGGSHDMGKVEPIYSKWVSGNISDSLSNIPEDGEHIDNQFNFEKHPRHNEISYLLFTLLASTDGLNQDNIERIKHTIFWHHAKPIRKSDFQDAATIFSLLVKNICESSLDNLFALSSDIAERVNVISESYDFEHRLPEFKSRLDEDIFDLLEGVRLPEYKSYSKRSSLSDYNRSILKNAKNNLMRSAVISADRIVSALSGEELSDLIRDKLLDKLLEKLHATDSDLKMNIEKCLAGFEERSPGSKRNTQQTDAASKLSIAENISVLNGPAGCGKTKIALEWAKLTDADKIIWVCPRVHVCMGLLNDLTSQDYLPEASIEINTGEFRYLIKNGNKKLLDDFDQFSGDIVITTIDQIVNTITTHNRITGLNHFMKSHVVFDEFHELINLSGFNILFTELVECKKLKRNKANTLLVSATPHYLFVSDVLGIDSEDIIGIESFNSNTYNIQYDEYEEGRQDDTNTFYMKQTENTFVISNTATTAQLSFIMNHKDENSLLLHSKFLKKDKEQLFNEAYQSFCRGGVPKYTVLRSGPIIQASLNISCSKMVSEFTTAENFLQRLGRLNRFGENNDLSLYIYAIPKNVLKGRAKTRCARFLDSQNSYDSAVKWYQFLKEKLNKKPITIIELYTIYSEFYKDKASSDAIKEELLNSFNAGIELINKKILDPVSFPTSKKSNAKIKKNSLRGENRFVQMAVCIANSLQSIEYSNDYAVNEENSDDFLTAPMYEICGNGDSRKSLLSFMLKKHHSIKNVKKSYNDNVLLNNARKQDSPVYLSYTTEDLKKVDSPPHVNAIYYVMSETQPIGCLDISKLNKKGE
jgi:CRISPR-associated endonuclease/helicase Cas3